MFIVIAPSMSEYNKSGDITKLKDKESLERYIRTYRGDIDRLQIYEAKELKVTVVVELKDA